MQVILRECPRCGKTKNITQFQYYKNRRGEHYFDCLSCEKETVGDLVKSLADPRAELFVRSYRHAVDRGFIHSIALDDIPTPVTCQYLGLRLEYPPLPKGTRWSKALAVLDRIDSFAGYVPGNVQVISHMANCMKYTASINELLAFAHGVIATHGPKPS